MKLIEIREKFLNYFKEKQHAIVSSSALVPANDPTLLFTNAGMVQFKDIFLGLETAAYSRATSSQRCVRAGGKHNDLENVGYTARHHTFFEMLGNFSFGDYFKREAIQFAWHFLTQELNIPEERLWVTVYLEDDEAADIWLNEIKINPQRFSRCGEADNFWSMGDTGPCGPCSEIFYDHGPEIEGGPPGSADADKDRYIEIWNLVFMQYNRAADGSQTLLPKPSVDTGMGLERIAAVVQGVHSNYAIDLFQNIIKAIAALATCKNLQHPSYNVVADHLRSCSFLIVDGVLPANEGRGYVLRRIIRRAIRHCHQLGLPQPSLHRLVKVLVAEMGTAYPELCAQQPHIENILLREEAQFERTLETGLKLFAQAVDELGTKKVIPGATVFKLYDTYGFPVDLTADLAREHNLSLDRLGFEEAMNKQRTQSRSASQFVAAHQEGIALDNTTDFVGYEQLATEAKVLVLLRDGRTVAALQTGDSGAIVVDKTPFYAESGGQVGDKGTIRYADAIFEVTDTQKNGQAYLHQGTVRSGTFQLENTVSIEVDRTHRQAIRLNHSATHLLHAALRQILGAHILQKGSLVDAEHLRFDFTHFEPLTAEQIQNVESLVNAEIRANHAVNTTIMSPKAASEQGAIGLFGEKYGEKVRVLAMGPFSLELCGGTHVAQTGEIGLYKIISEVGIAAGVRRIEAITGPKALQWLHAQEQQLRQLSAVLKAEQANLLVKAEQLVSNNRDLEKQLEQTKAKQAQLTVADLATQAIDVDGIKILATRVEGVLAKDLRLILDKLKDKLQRAVVILVVVEGEKTQVVAGVTKNCLGQVPAAKTYVQMLCGRGGGRDDMAQGGGALVTDLEAKFAEIIHEIKTWRCNG